MSWQEYVDNQLLGTGMVTNAAICGLDGSVWAKSAGLASVDAGEVKNIVNGFTDPGHLQAGGLKLNGVKFIYLSGADNVIRAKSQDKKTGLHCVKTTKAVVISTYGDPIQPQQAATVVENLGDYLVKCGF